MPFPLAHSVLDAALAARAFPAAVIEVGRAETVLWQQAFGRLRYDPASPATTLDTVFDLASLTKVIATTSFVMQQMARGRLDLEAQLIDISPAWAVPAWGGIRVRHLLDHSSGFPAHARLWEHAHGRDAFEADLRAVPLEAAPGTRSVYSDVGFILLGFLLETVAGMSLDAQMRALNGELALGPLQYRPPAEWLARTAPTEFDPWRNRLLAGEVHDENASALGGASGHAGLFGTAGAVGTFARAILAAVKAPASAASWLALASHFAQRTGVPGSSRALGWDTMLPSSSCGTRMSPRAIGHTGFTGTSLWLDPEQDLYVVLLTNRVFPSRTNEALRPIRPKVHDAVIEDLERTAAGR